jgi:RimJ/RimL family protein N-acetyltransferase
MPGAWAIQGFGMFSVVEKSSGQWIGQTGPWKPEGWPGNEVGWAFHPSAWGKGYATEATVAAVDWAFANLGWTDMIHCIAPANRASQALAQRIGSKLRGPGKLPPPYEDSPTEIWTQARVDWLARRNGASA